MLLSYKRAFITIQPGFMELFIVDERILPAIGALENLLHPFHALNSCLPFPPVFVEMRTGAFRTANINAQIILRDLNGNALGVAAMETVHIIPPALP